MIRIKTICTGLCVLVFTTFSIFSTQPKTDKITFLHFNDIYDFLPEGNNGGMAELLTLLEEQREKFPDALTIVSGDFLSPSILTTTTRGKHIVELFNKMNVDFVTFGNHEFDMGPEVLLERMKESTFTWINSNVFNKSKQPFGNSYPTMMKKMRGVNVGFLGITSTESAILSRPGKSLHFGDPIESAQKAVKNLKDQGAQIIVAITHLDFAEDLDLVKNVKGIHLLLGGHDHFPITWEEGGTLIQKSGTQGQYLAVIHLILDHDQKGQLKQTIPEWAMLSSHGVQPSPKLKDEIDHYESILAETLKEPLVIIPSSLDSRTEMVRTQETSMGNLVADSLREGYQADVSFINGGSIRGNRLYPKGTQITKGDILRELPFGNIGIKIQLKGEELKSRLEYGVSEINKRSGRFPQISGITMWVDENAAVGDRIKKIMVNGTLLDPQKVYSVATSDYIAEGGDGYKEVSPYAYLISDKEGEPISKMVIDRLKQQKKVDLPVDSRIIFLRIHLKT